MSPRLAPAAVVLAVLMSPGAQARAQAQVRAQGPDVAPERVVLVTGSTDGLGREVALGLARPGTHVLVHGRDRERGAAVVRAIREAGGTARFHPADLADLSQVRALAAAVRAEHDRLDVLVNNAGIWLEGEERRVSRDGHELHFAVNYLSHYLLTRLLLPLLLEGAPARIVNVSSGAQQAIDFDDPMLTRGYSAGRGYAQSKLAQVLFTIDLARELEGTGVTVNALHPATMMNTSMVLSRGARARSTVEEGAAAVLRLIEEADVGTGRFYDRTRPARAHAQAYDEDARARLRRLSETLTRGG